MKTVLSVQRMKKLCVPFFRVFVKNQTKTQSVIATPVSCVLQMKNPYAPNLEVVYVKNRTKMQNATSRTVSPVRRMKKLYVPLVTAHVPVKKQMKPSHAVRTHVSHAVMAKFHNVPQPVVNVYQEEIPVLVLNASVLNVA